MALIDLTNSFTDDAHSFFVWVAILLFSLLTAYDVLHNLGCEIVLKIILHVLFHLIVVIIFFFLGLLLLGLDYFLLLLELLHGLSHLQLLLVHRLLIHYVLELLL